MGTIMKRHVFVVGMLAGLIALTLGGDLFACGDKYLCGSRGTRYQRPKNARAHLAQEPRSRRRPYPAIPQTRRRLGPRLPIGRRA